MLWAETVSCSAISAPPSAVDRQAVETAMMSVMMAVVLGCINAKVLLMVHLFTLLYGVIGSPISFVSNFRMA